MNIKEVVYCYVSKEVPMQQDMVTLRTSFIESGFKEISSTENRFVFKRGASLALEFDYNSEAIEMQVILEKLENSLKISVGNWGFPFEPLLMKKRFQKNLESISEQIISKGVLTADKALTNKIAHQAKSKNRAAKSFLFCSFLLLIGTFVYAVISQT